MQHKMHTPIYGVSHSVVIIDDHRACDIPNCPGGNCFFVFFDIPLEYHHPSWLYSLNVAPWHHPIYWI